MDKRGFKIGTSGLEIEAPSASDQQGSKINTSPDFRKPDHLAPALLDYQLRMEETVKGAIDEGTKRTGLDVVSFLIRATADFGTALNLERIYLLIFGSQIKAVQYVVNRGGSAALADIEGIFKEASQKYPEFYEKITFEDWLSYLLRVELFRLTDKKIEATDIGRAFIPYITGRGYSTERYA